MTAPAVTQDEFREMCRRHDITHEFSDDGSVARAGREDLRRIREAAKGLPPGEAARIWNERVRAYFIHEVDAKMFLWPESEVAA